MTNKTITLDRELVSRIVGLRPDYTCAQLDADEELVRAALADPVPPAGVDLVECDACPTSGGCVGKCMKAPAGGDLEAHHNEVISHDTNTGNADHGGSVPCTADADSCAIDVLKLQDVANAYIRQGDVSGALMTVADILGHVTRLQAEVERLKQVAHGFVSEIELKDTELTKARELLRSARASVATHNTSNWSSRLLQGIDAFFSNQSAPADKGGDS